jgi:hypothetical protein
MRKLVLSSNEEEKNLVGRNLIGEPSMLESMSGEVKGARRVITRLLNIPGDNPKIVAQGYYNTIEYDVDEGGELKFSEKEGIATFTSREVQYKIRAVQEDDGSAWAALQEAKRG